MNVVIQGLGAVHQEAYQRIRKLDEFTVTLTHLPGSKDCGLKIRSKNLHINIAKLKPETRDHFLSLQPALKSPISNPVPFSPDTISSMNSSSILKEPRLLWTLMVSTFREWMSSLHKLIFGNSVSDTTKKHVSFAPGTVDGSTSKPKKRRAPASAPRDQAPDSESQPTSAFRLPVVEINGHQGDASDDDYLPNPDYKGPESSKEKEPKIHQTPDSDSKFRRVAKDLPHPIERVYPHELSSYEKLIPLPDAKPQRTRSIMLEPSDTPSAQPHEREKNNIPDSAYQLSAVLKDLPPLEKLLLPSEPLPDAKPIPNAAEKTAAEDPKPLGISNPKDEDFEVVPSRESAPGEERKLETAEAPMEYSPVPLNESDRAKATIISLLRSQFQSSPVRITSQEEVTPFGLYLFNEIFPIHQFQSCEMDTETGRFKLTFAEAKQIPLTRLPPVKSKQTLEKLKNALNTTLHVAKEVKGKFDYEKGTVEFDEGSLTIQWTKLWKNWTAYLLDIQPHPQNSLFLIFKGKFLGMTENQSILAQDFADFLECNINEAKRKGLLS